MPNPGCPPPGGNSRPSTPAEDPLPHRPTTRSSTIPVETIRNNPAEHVKDIHSARKLLDSMQYTIEGEPMTLEHLSHALFYMSQRVVMPTIRSMIHAAGFLTLELASSLIVSSVKQALVSTDLTDPLSSTHHTKISEATSKLNLALDKWSAQQETWMKTLDKILQTDDPINMIQLETQIHSISEGMAVIQKTVEEMKTQNAASTLMVPQQHCSCHPSYREALTNHPSPPDDICPPKDHARAQTAVKERQILINLARDHPVSKQICSRKELIAIFQTALTNKTDDNTPDLGLKSLTILCNGGILLELLSKEAAQWLSDSSHLESLSATSGSKLTIKARTFNIVVPFLPTSTDLKDPNTLRMMEVDNKIPCGSIMTACWIKPP